MGGGELNITPVDAAHTGLSDIIEEFLRQHNALTENITVCSNRLNYGTDYVPASVSPEQPVTSFTKAQAYHNAAGFFRLHHNRRMILVIGDSVSDIDAAQNVPYDETLSVGFLNSRVSSRLLRGELQHTMSAHPILLLARQPL